MFNSGIGNPWLSRVHHDLIKRLLWFARDCRDAGREPTEGELVAIVYDEEGKPVDAERLWEDLCETAPTSVGLQDFGSSLRACLEAARNNDLPGVLQLDAAFERLRATVASSLNKPGLNTKGSL